MTIWSGDFSGMEDLAQWDGAVAHLSRPGTDLLFADYDTGCYDGSALAIWRDEDGTLYEASCSHCSCNGLDDFSPEATTVEALLMRRRVKGNAALVAALMKGAAK